MKADFKAIARFEPDFMNLSEKLRTELEFKIDKLYKQNRFNQYAHIPYSGFEETIEDDSLCAYLLNRAPKDDIRSGKLSQAIKTWFTMLDNDRLSVTDKFITYYQKVMPSETMDKKQVLSVAFCKFLISELISILSENRWQSLINYMTNYRQQLYN